MKKKPKPTVSRQVPIRFPDVIYREIKTVADSEGRAFGEYVRSAALREARGAK